VPEEGPSRRGSAGKRGRAQPVSVPGEAPRRSRGRRWIIVGCGVAIIVFACWWVVGECWVDSGNRREVRKNLSVAVVYSPGYEIRLGGLEKLHSFDIRKYSKIYAALTREGLLDPTKVCSPEPATDEQILLVHSEAFLASLNDKHTVARYLEAGIVKILPASLLRKKVLMPFRRATGGTIVAARQAMRCGIAVNLGGGFHHAKPDAGEGFCIFADMPIAIRVLQKEEKIKRALVIDLDVHQGNGTAVCHAGDDSVYTFSMHQGSIYPHPKEISDRDIELASGTGDKEYLARLKRELPGLFERAKPDIVFLQAGCDTLEGDPLASLRMTEKGIVIRDSMVIDACVARNIPVVMTLGGGYSKSAWHVQYMSVAAILKKYKQAAPEGGGSATPPPAPKKLNLPPSKFGKKL
jgi:histone deacetylase 11